VITNIKAAKPKPGLMATRRQAECLKSAMGTKTGTIYDFEGKKKVNHYFNK
jgi:hypothetical protein